MGAAKHCGVSPIVSRAQICGALACAALACLLCGCQTGPSLIPDDQQKPIDRNIVEYPPNVGLTLYGHGFTAPAAIAFDYDEGEHKGTMFVAESGRGGHSARIYGFKPDGTYFDIYPKGRLAQLAQLPPIQKLPFDIGHGPFELDHIGGMVVSCGKIFVTHEDRDGRGRISAFNYDGSHFTVEGDFPAEGDYGMTDIAVRPSDGRIFVGLGSMTNSGVVGVDNFQTGWVKDHPLACDMPFGNLRLLGYRFDTHNPLAGLFGPDDTAVTAPFQAFNHSNQTRIPAAPNGKPTGAIYSVSPGGGDLQVEATGLHNPRGLAFDAYSLYFTDDGMQMRGTRPVKDDPDALLKLVRGTWYGFPDFSRDLNSIGDGTFQPPAEMIIVSGYPELSPVINREESNLISPALARDTLLRATFPSLSGAARMDIVPSDGPFHDYRGNAIVALDGDRAPWATSGAPLKGPVGYKVVRVDPDMNNGPVADFVRNTRGLPAHLLGRDSDNALERPIDVKFGPDGALYILDFGPLRSENGREKIPDHAGRIFRLGPPRPPTTKPSGRDDLAP
jgi:glucose/arabinose dehydrogenase